MKNPQLSHARASGRTRKSGRATAPDLIKSVAPTRDALDRLLAIPLLESDDAATTRMEGRTVFDSWQSGPAIALRDVTDGHVRRLRLAAGRFELDLLAERIGRRWEFVARLRQGDRVVHRCVLKVGRRRLLAERGGYFHWASTSVPGDLAVLLAKSELVFERIRWR
jgi:hypothetical protein